MTQTVLIVDDDPHIRAWLGEFLRASGYAAVPLADARDALAYLRGGGSADLMLLDICMPGTSGWQLLLHRLDDPALRAVPVVIMTARPTDPGWAVVNFHADALLHKPLDVESLLATVRRCCRTLPPDTPSGQV